MGRLTCGPGSHFHWIILKKIQRKSHHEPHRPANRPRPRQEGETETDRPLQALALTMIRTCKQQQHTPLPHEMQLPKTGLPARLVESPSQASGSLAAAPCSTYSSSVAAPRETHGLRPRRSEAHIDTHCRDPLPGVALCGLAATPAFPRSRSQSRALSPREHVC